jgi:hypothetical protein
VSTEQQQTSDVGYGKPPKQHQFKAGQSGNPKGRRKGSENLDTLLMKVLEETVTINENGRRKTVSKLHAIVKQIVNKAAAGDARAIKLLTALMRESECNTPQPLTVYNYVGVEDRL